MESRRFCFVFRGSTCCNHIKEWCFRLDEMDEEVLLTGHLKWWHSQTNDKHIKEWWPRTSMVFFVGLILCAQGTWDPWCFILKSLPGTFDLLKGKVFRRERKLNQIKERNLLKHAKKLEVKSAIRRTMRRMPFFFTVTFLNFPMGFLARTKNLVHWLFFGDWDV